MSYLVLARKYRPLSFAAMVGQEHVVQALSNALTQQRLHHAYLFTGTRGVGKTTVSRILAKSLNCTGPDGQGGITAQPCGVCDACRDIDSGRFVDYVELDAASNRGVEEISQLLDQAVYKPVMGRFKVYMVDEVHMLSNHAFNAMLKTLEEPPEYLKFVLATTDPQKVPPTVLSRCLQFNLRPMAADTVQAYLGEVLAAETIASEPAALRLLARAARGSMRDALSLTDQAIAFGAGALTEAGIRQMLGAVDRGHAVRLLDALAAADGAALLASADALRALGLSAVGTLEEMAELLQQMAVRQAVPSAVRGEESEQAEVTRLSSLFAADETALMYSMCLHGRAEIGLAPDEHGGLVMVLLRMLAFRPDEPTDTTSAPPGAVPRAARPLQVAQVAKAQVPVAPARVTLTVPSQPSLPPSTVALPPLRPAVALQAPTPVAVPELPAPVVIAAPQARDDDMPPWLDAPEIDADSAPGLPGRRPAEAPAAAQAWGERGEDAGPELAPEPLPGEPALAQAPRGVARQRPTPAERSSVRQPLAPRLVPTALGEQWNALVIALIERGRISALVRELAWQAQCVAAPQPGEGVPAVWRLRVEREMLRAPAHVDRLQAALTEHSQQTVRLETEAGTATDTPALRATAEREQRQLAAEVLISQDPVVVSLLSQFKSARIVPGSIQPC